MPIRQIVLSCLVLFTSGPLAGANTAGLEPVLALREAAWRAWFAGDDASLRQILPEDFLAIGAGDSPIVNREETIAQSLAFRKAGGRLTSLTFPETRAQWLGADVVVIYGSYDATYVTGEHETTMRGRLTEVFLRREGRWVHPGWHLDLR
jgi:hypothetical protein